MWFLDLLSDPFEHLKTFIVGVLGLFNSSAHKVNLCALLWVYKINIYQDYLYSDR